MHRRSVGGIVVVAVILIVGFSTVGVAGAVTSDRPPVSTTEWDNVTVEQELRLTPDTPGEIEVMVSVTLPDRMTEFELRAPRDATVTDTDDFEKTVSRRYEWTEGTQNPTITYDLEANRTARGDGPEPGAGTYLFADTGSWALVRPPDPGVRYRWQYSEGEAIEVGIDRTRRVEGAGATGEVVAFLGAQQTYSRTANGQTFELVVPETASMRPTVEDTFDALADASEELRVGDRDERVFTVAAPTSVDWAVLGLQTGDSDMWVAADESVDTADNTWFHEYVHTRQQLNTTDSTRWLIEATATYHAAELAFATDRADFENFESVLARGTRNRYDDVVLADNSTWTGLAEYHKGSLVVGKLDRRIRLASDRSRSFEGVFDALNDGERFDHADFRGTVGRLGNGSVASFADRFVTSTDGPSMWTHEQHGAAFGAAPAQFTYAIERETSTYGIEGRYRNVSVDTIPRLVPGETLTVPVSITNVGGSTGTYDVTLTVDGTGVARASGELEAGESTAVRLGHTFEEQDRYRIAVGSNETTVDVVEPASPSVGSLTVEPTVLDSPGNVTLTATARNDADVPATSSIPFTVNGTTAAERRVSLAPGETRTVETSIELSEPGRYVLGAGNRTATVAVDPARFTYEHSDADGIAIAGQYRNVTVETIPSLVAGETMTIPVTVTNAGGLSGTYNATLSIDGEVVARANGSMQAEDSRTVRLSHTFDQPGQYQLGVGETETTVDVVEPASPSVSNVEVNRTALDTAGAVTLTATVANDAEIPGETPISFTRNGSSITEKLLSLAPGETRSSSVSVSIATPGTYELGANERTTIVTVEDTGFDDSTQAITATPGSADGDGRTSEDAPRTESDGDGPTATTTSGPGFSAVLAIVAAALVALRRR